MRRPVARNALWTLSWLMFDFAAELRTLQNTKLGTSKVSTSISDACHAKLRVPAAARISHWKLPPKQMIGTSAWAGSVFG